MGRLVAVRSARRHGARLVPAWGADLGIALLAGGLVEPGTTAGRWFQT